MTPTDIDTAARARALLDAATPGPWRVNTITHRVYAATEDNPDEYVAFAPFDMDAALIAAAPALITDLLAELDQQKQKVEAFAADLTAFAERALTAEAERDAAVALSADRLYLLQKAEAERDAAVARAVQLGTDIDSVRSCWHANEGPRWTANVIEALRHSGLMDAAAVDRGTDR